MSEQPIRVIIAEDDPSIRRLLRLLLNGLDDMEVAGETGVSQQGLEMIERAHADVALLGCPMDDLDCVEAVSAIRARSDMAIIVLDSYGEHDRDARKAGADGYLLKDARRDDIISAIRNSARQQQTELDQAAK